ncbi:hypothetical protein PtA15_10A564 [Puccinia triticina]|uniref:Uncharacterized protein n=1 Tax=Puccinia triticina TaxID=208348 RepID=A0ABY7CVZ6_9BASI|nr:uncharacterized protein PtA15_10A564 [Puccinia triticina]WAQ89140.1 hypothetical protein PtA15_10A564 [Puccinia triticina]WAR59196.1 hypothetical protein PtB15_10B538 [Puccinia triticina]
MTQFCMTRSENFKKEKTNSSDHGLREEHMTGISGEASMTITKTDDSHHHPCSADFTDPGWAGGSIHRLTVVVIDMGEHTRRPCLTPPSQAPASQQPAPQISTLVVVQRSSHSDSSHM